MKRTDMIQCAYCDYGSCYNVANVKRHMESVHSKKKLKWIDRRKEKDVQKRYLEWRGLCFSLKKNGSGDVEMVEKNPPVAASEEKRKKKKQMPVQKGEKWTKMRMDQKVVDGNLESEEMEVQDQESSGNLVMLAEVATNSMVQIGSEVGQSQIVLEKLKSMIDSAERQSESMEVATIQNETGASGHGMVAVSKDAREAWCQLCNVTIARQEVSVQIWNRHKIRHYNINILVKCQTLNGSYL